MGSDEERPRLVRTVLSDKVSAITAAQAITAALLARERSGQGQHVRLSMLDAVLQFLWGVLVVHEAMPATRWIGFVLVWVALVVFTADLVRHARAVRPRVAQSIRPGWRFRQAGRPAESRNSG